MSAPRVRPFQSPDSLREETQKADGKSSQPYVSGLTRAAGQRDARIAAGQFPWRGGVFTTEGKATEGVSITAAWARDEPGQTCIPEGDRGFTGTHAEGRFTRQPSGLFPPQSPS